MNNNNRRPNNNGNNNRRPNNMQNSMTRGNPPPQSDISSNNNSFLASPRNNKPKPKPQQASATNFNNSNTNMNRTPPRGNTMNRSSPNNQRGMEMKRSESPNFTPSRSNINGSMTSTPKRGMSAKQRKFYERLQNHKRKKASSPSPIRSSNVQVNRGMEVHYDSRVPEQEKIFDPNKSINLMAQDPYA